MHTQMDTQTHTDRHTDIYTGRYTHTTGVPRGGRAAEQYSLWVMEVCLLLRSHLPT